MVFTFNKFQPYLIQLKVTIFTDQVALRHLLNKTDTKPRLIRWVLLLQEFNLEMKDKRGTADGVANHLSRLEYTQMEPQGVKGIDDVLPEEHFYGVPK